MSTIGLDIGTTRCKVAYVDVTGKPVSLLNDRGQAQTPSVLHLADPNNPLIGIDAAEQSYIDPEHFIQNFKLDLGSTENLLNSSPIITPTDATSMLIAYLKSCAEKSLGTAVTEAVFTCPANFRDDAKQALIEAAEQNGIEVLKLVPEPTAAAIAHALHSQAHESQNLIYDFGGGTLDCSLVAVNGSQLKVLATEGVPKLGGNDFNEPLRTRIYQEIEAKFGEVPTQDEDGLLHLDIQNKCENAKFSLGNRKTVLVVVGLRGTQVIVEFSQEEYFKSIVPLIDQSLEALDASIKQAGLSYTDIDNLVMVGGTSRFGYVQERVAQHTGLQPKFDIEPESAIAFGAALSAVQELGKQGRQTTIGGKVIPSPKMFSTDCTAHSIGCCVSDTTKGKGQLVNSVMISKNAPIPCQKTDQFYLESEKQNAAIIEILQGNEGADREECLIIGEIRIDDLPTEAVRTERIQVEYTIDANGMVTVTATDKVSGKQQTVSVDYKKGIQPKHKPAMVQG